MENKMMSLFVPCYNEERVLGKNIKKIYSVLKDYQKKNRRFKFEIVIVNDCSKDRTRDVADSLSKQFKEVRAIHYQAIKPTRRENLIRSFKDARGEVIAFTDADLSTDITDLPRLFEEVDGDRTVVVGDRYAVGSQVKRSGKRYVISKSLNYLTRLLFFDWRRFWTFDSGSRDHFCGFKAFSKRGVLNLLNHTGIGDSWRGMWWDAEMLIFAERLGYKIKRIPVKWVEGKTTALRVKRELKMLWYILKFRVKMLRWTKSTKSG